MKRHIILIIVGILFLSPLTYTQITPYNFSIGPRVGVNFSNVSQIEDASMLTGFVAGITSTYSINEQSGVTVEVLFSEEGYSLGDTDFEFNYLRIPVLYNIFFGELGQTFRPKVFLGPQLGFLLSSSIDKKDLNKFSLGLGAGLGFNYQVADRVWLNTDLRSFFDLNQLGTTNQIPDKTRIRNIHLSLGIAWGL